MMIIEHAIAPDTGPAVLLECLLEIRLGGIENCLAVDQDWQPSVVWDPVTWFKRFVLDVHRSWPVEDRAAATAEARIRPTTESRNGSEIKCHFCAGSGTTSYHGAFDLSFMKKGR